MHRILLAASLLLVVAIIAWVLVPIGRGRVDRRRIFGAFFPLLASVALTGWVESGSVIQIIAMAFWLAMSICVFIVLYRDRDAFCAPLRRPG
jgi:hypothetical protein